RQIGRGHRFEQPVLLEKVLVLGMAHVRQGREEGERDKTSGHQRPPPYFLGSGLPGRPTQGDEGEPITFDRRRRARPHAQRVRARGGGWSWGGGGGLGSTSLPSLGPSGYGSAGGTSTVALCTIGANAPDGARRPIATETRTPGRGGGITRRP